MKFAPLALVAALLAAPAAAHEKTAGNLQIIHPNIPLPAPHAISAAGYMAIANDGHAPDHLIEVHTDFAKSAMVHQTVTSADGVAQMRPLPVLEIPADDTVVLEPGGMHVMFMGLAADAKEGDMIPVTLVFEHAGEVVVEFMVDPAGGMDHAAMDHSAMDHSAMDHGAADGMSMAGMTDEVAIKALLMGTFDRPDAPLSVAPITVMGQVAVAGWSQDGDGGRAFLRKDHDGWFVEICSGESLVHPATFQSMGLGQAEAEMLAAEVNGAETPLGAEFVARLNSFEGTVVIGRAGHEHHGN